MLSNNKKVTNMQSTKQNKSAAMTASELESAAFPSARYFQIHFEQIHAELVDTRRSLDDLKQQIQALNGLPNQTKT